MIFTQSKKLFAAEPAVAADNDPDVREALANRRDDFRKSLDHGVDRGFIGRQKFRPEQKTAGETIQGQVAVAVIVAVKEPAELFAMQRIVRVVEIEHHFVGIGRQEVDRQIQKGFLQSGKIGVNLMVFGLALGAHFDAVECGGTGQGLVGVVQTIFSEQVPLTHG